ncbi:glycoside hydrolase family 5 protein [Coprinopsis marcescibilis]|uniref:Glycoside hydrolase family 5 protein n=1 Tax=Coprinopsis marcescibilis TaxID=230819 RepID=A0A5C3KII9_COPMA|nr:glycoside hydrolase family 5 protein [Coprinopsis marcescibilis]
MKVPLHLTTVCLSFLFATLAIARAASIPPKIYGVNLGSWLLIEPWMLPQEWLDMGGQSCSDCSKCIATEFAFAQAYPNTVDATFNKHWTTWFNQTDVDQLVAAGLNTVRIPLGYWIVESLVDRRTEYFPKGGIHQLQRGLRQLRNAGITVILDHHALPGAQAENQMFAGRCTSSPQFYTPSNYHRALVWSGVMTALSHVDPAFETVASLHAVNEPIMDASKTPGYGTFQKNFVQIVRAVEIALGISVDQSYEDSKPPGVRSAHNVTEALNAMSGATNSFSGEVIQVLKDMIPIISGVAVQLSVNMEFNQHGLREQLKNRTPLVTNFMDISWQHNNPANPADAAIGPQTYDNHLYYSFGGVADPNEEAYLSHLCNLDRIEKDAALGNTPLWFGEWSLSTQFSATDAFLHKWADAQKLQYSKGAGWIFWNFKIEISARAGNTARQWSYMEGLRRGYFTLDPSKLHDPHVCDPYVRK